VPAPATAPEERRPGRPDAGGDRPDRGGRLRGQLALVGLLALQIALHLAYLDQPPYGRHTWRQTLTLSVARNFHEESMNPFYPRIDARGPHTGVTGMEFPLLNYIIAVGYRAAGVSPIVERVVPLGFSLLAIVGCVAWAHTLLGSLALGLLAGIFLVFAPLLLHYSITALPEVPMLAFLLLGLAALARWSTTGRAWHAIAGTGALALAALVKISAVVAWPAALVLIARGWRRTDARGRTTCLAGIGAAVGLPLAWYAWARHLDATYGIAAFRLEPAFPYPLAVVPGLLVKVLLQWLPEFWVSYPEFALLLLGVWQLLRVDAYGVRPVVLAYACGLAAFTIAMLPTLRVHDYYMMPALPLLVLLVTLGFDRLVAAVRDRPRLRRAVPVAALLLCAAVGGWRGLSRLAAEPPDAELMAMAEHLESAIPNRDALIVVASDPSPSIYLYFMRRKGWSVSAPVRPERFARMRARGARYLVSDSRVLERQPGVRPSLHLMSSYGRFNVFRLDP
jgi:hypothetical protein